MSGFVRTGNIWIHEVFSNSRSPYSIIFHWQYFTFLRKDFLSVFFPFFYFIYSKDNKEKVIRLYDQLKFVCESPGPVYCSVSICCSQTMQAHTYDGPFWFFSIKCSWTHPAGEKVVHTQHGAFFLTSCYQALRYTYTASVYTYLRQ